MRLGKRYLRLKINSDTLDAICQHYEALKAELVLNTTTSRCGQTGEDLLHQAIMITASLELSDNIGDIIEEVKRKYHSLRIGIDLEVRASKEIITDIDLSNYAEDNQD